MWKLPESIDQRDNRYDFINALYEEGFQVYRVADDKV